MRVIVTGGTGLIGHHLVMNLAQDGHEVVILSRNPKQSGPMPETVSFQQYDAKTADGWGHIVEGADAIVNLAGENIAGNGFLPTRWSPERKKKIRQSRVDVGNAITEAIKGATNKPKALIQASAVGYYGTHPMSKDITEEDPAGDDFLASVCVDWEASTAAVEDMGVRRVIVRTGIVLDKDDGTLLRLALPFKLFTGGPLGNGKQPMPWIHIEDEVRAIRFLIEHEDAQGPFNLVAPGVVNNTDFSRALGKALGRPSFIPAPGFAFKAAFGELATLLLDGQKALPKRLQELGFAFTYPEVQQALDAIYKDKELATAS
jgi:uncharacterized protein